MEIALLFLIIVGMIILQTPAKNWLEKFNTRRHYKRFLAQEPYYHSIVSKYCKYYNRLGAEDQRRFLFRTFLFRRAKKFHYIEVAETPEMPILISAASVQVTLGLDKFLMSYFRDIYVLRDDYHYGFYSRPFQGHVDHSGIYFSWDNFIKGLRGQTPNCNVGLHEMGHALAYVNFITQTDEDKHFKKEFKNFSKVARPIFTAIQEGKKSILGDYAGVNYHEFWAVSVEVFFENPLRMKHDLPELYEAMRNLLKQDPLEVFFRARAAA